MPDARAEQRDGLVAAYDPDVVCTVTGPDDVRRETTAHDLHPAPGDTVHLRVTGLVRAYRPAGTA